MLTKEKQWKLTATGNWLYADGKWLIRGPIFGKLMYWLYDAANHCRYTPTGKYDDCLSFSSLKEAKEFVEKNAPVSRSSPKRVRVSG